MLSASLPTVAGPLPPKPVSNRMTLPPVRIAVTVKGLSNLSGPMPPAVSAFLTSSSEAFLTIALGDHALDAAVMQAENLDIADLVFEAVGGALRMRSADKGNRTFQSENECCPGASENQIATRNLEHWPCSLG